MRTAWPWRAGQELVALFLLWTWSAGSAGAAHALPLLAAGAVGGGLLGRARRPPVQAAGGGVLLAWGGVLLLLGQAGHAVALWAGAWRGIAAARVRAEATATHAAFLLAATVLLLVIQPSLPLPLALAAAATSAGTGFFAVWSAASRTRPGAGWEGAALAALLAAVSLAFSLLLRPRALHAVAVATGTILSLLLQAAATLLYPVALGLWYVLRHLLARARERPPQRPPGLHPLVGPHRPGAASHPWQPNLAHLWPFLAAAALAVLAWRLMRTSPPPRPEGPHPEPAEERIRLPRQSQIARRRRHPGALSPTRALYRRVLRQLARQGHPRGPAQTPRQYLRALRAEGAAPPGLEPLTALYEEERYGDRPAPPAAVAALRQQLALGRKAPSGDKGAM